MVGLALLASACGVPTGGPPETIAPAAIPYGLASPTPTSAPSPSPPPRGDAPLIYLVTADDVLVPRGRAVVEGTLEEQLTQLLAELAEGPSSQELDEELTTALPPEVSLDLTAVDGDTATIDISTSEESPSERDSRRATGQIVLTATSLPGIRGVLLTREGEPLEAPLPSGELTSEPLQAEDYAALLSSPPS